MVLTLAMIVYALYNEKKAVLLVILAAFVAEIVMMIVCLCFVLPTMSFTSACLVAHASGIFVSYWYV